MMVPERSNLTKDKHEQDNSERGQFLERKSLKKNSCGKEKYENDNVAKENNSEKEKSEQGQS